MDMNTFFSSNLPACAGLLFLIFFLRGNTVLKKKIKRIFYEVIFLEFVGILVYNAELWTATFPEPTILRIVLTAAGYSLCPFLVYMMLMIELRHEERSYIKHVLAIPAIINVIVSYSALFTDIAYSYDARNVLQRGPLGYFSVAIMLLYLVIIWIIVCRNLKKGSRMEATIIFGISIYIIVTMTVEIIFTTRDTGRMVMVLSTIFYYMYFQTQNFENSLDQEQQLRENAEEKAQIDSLTGIFNKEAFLNMAQESIMDSVDEYGAFLFMDLDHFKEVNDQLGHLTGDRVLREVADKIKKSFREYDVVGRFGGDEFCALLKNISYEVLCKRLNSMLDLIRDEYTDGESTVRVSISIGAVYFKCSQELRILEILNLADEGVYTAKNAGRDKYVIRCLDR